MQDMIAQIVEVDEKARKMMDEAQRSKVVSEREIAVKRNQLREDYLTRAHARIKENEVIERANADAVLKAATEENASILKKLDEVYAQKCDEWVNMIVNRVIGE